ncbi:hypothetical protein EJB05_43847, partial [Eragrostis curvula]
MVNHRKSFAKVVTSCGKCLPRAGTKALGKKSLPSAAVFAERGASLLPSLSLIRFFHLSRPAAPPPHRLPRPPPRRRLPRPPRAAASRALPRAAASRSPAPPPPAPFAHAGLPFAHAAASPTTVPAPASPTTAPGPPSPAPPPPAPFPDHRRLPRAAASPTRPARLRPRRPRAAAPLPRPLPPLPRPPTCCPDAPRTPTPLPGPPTPAPPTPSTASFPAAPARRAAFLLLPPKQQGLWPDVLPPCSLLHSSRDSCLTCCPLPRLDVRAAGTAPCSSSSRRGEAFPPSFTRHFAGQQGNV